MKTWQIKGCQITISDGRPLIMGILNITPDSFSDGGLYLSAEAALSRAAAMVNDGADIIDIGGQSTRPGHTPISPEEEWGRLEGILPRLCSELSVPVSVDTYSPFVAGRALQCGAAIINDVTGFDSSEMRTLAAQSGCGCVIMHHDDITDRPDPIAAVRDFFARRAAECIAAGIRPGQIALDVGIGFGKTREQELALLRQCGECRVDNLPIFVGASRKRLIAWLMNQPECPPEQRDAATHEAHAIAVNAGAEIIRVHDVKGAVGKVDDYL